MNLLSSLLHRRSTSSTTERTFSGDSASSTAVIAVGDAEVGPAATLDPVTVVADPGVAADATAVAAAAVADAMVVADEVAVDEDEVVDPPPLVVCR